MRRNIRNRINIRRARRRVNTLRKGSILRKISLIPLIRPKGSPIRTGIIAAKE